MFPYFFCVNGETIMQATLAATSFQTGADEKLAAADVYATAPQTPIGAISDTVGTTTSLFGLDSLVSSSGGFGGLLSGDLGKALGGSFGSLESGIKTVTSILGGDKSILKDLQKGMVGDLLAATGYGDAALGIAGSLMSGGDPMSVLEGLAKNNPQMRLISEGIETLVSVKDVSSIEDLLNVATKMSGMEGLGEILQIGPQLGMFKTLIDKANLLGIPQLASAIIDRIDNPSDKKTLEISSALGAARGSNLDMLTLTLEKYGNDGVIGSYPSIVKTLLASYRIDTDEGVPTPALATQLIELCNSLDVNWLYVERDTALVPSLDALIGMSVDARSLFYMDEVMRPLAMTSTGYTSTSLISIAQRQYPSTPLSLTA